MTWIILLPVCLLFVVGSVFSYRADLRASGWFLPVYLAVSVGCALCWVVAARSLNDGRSILFFSLVWDVLMVACYYLLPLALFDFRFNRWAWAGFALMLAGLVLVKVAG